MTVWQVIQDLVTKVLTAIGSFISGAMTTVQSIFSTVWQSISSVISSVLGVIRTVISTVFNGVKQFISTVWNTISTTISTIINSIKNTISTVFNAVSTIVSSVFNAIKSTAQTVWNGIKQAIVTPIEAAKNKVKSVVDAITGFFSGIRLQLPHIKLPHFSIRGSFSLAPPSVPHLGIDWYKEGGIMTRPTIFGMNGSSLMAGGEAGAEAILPLRGFYSQLNKMLDEKLSMNHLESYLQIIADNSSKGIYLEDGTLVGKLLPAIDTGLSKLAIRRERG